MVFTFMTVCMCSFNIPVLSFVTCSEGKGLLLLRPSIDITLVHRMLDVLYKCSIVYM